MISGFFQRCRTYEWSAAISAVAFPGQAHGTTLFWLDRRGTRKREVEGNPYRWPWRLIVFAIHLPDNTSYIYPQPFLLLLLSPSNLAHPLPLCPCVGLSTTFDWYFAKHSLPDASNSDLARRAVRGTDQLCRLRCLRGGGDVGGFPWDLMCSKEFWLTLYLVRFERYFQ